MTKRIARRFVPAVDLSIDFDFFIREEYIWDFGHSEDSGFTGISWMHRYDSLNLWTETALRTYADFMPYRMVQKLDEKNIRIPKGAHVIVADSHRHAFEVFRRSPADVLVNIDAHHDCFTGGHRPLDCGNWVMHLRGARKGLKVQQVYPKWKDTDAERAPLAVMAPDIYRTAAPNWDAWAGLPDVHEARTIFLCFSSAWVPPHHWPAFEGLAQLLAAHAETDLVEVGGAFPILKPENFPQSAKENEERVVARRKEWAQIRAGITPEGYEAVTGKAREGGG